MTPMLTRHGSKDDVVLSVKRGHTLAQQLHNL
jgi:hypothetical protein